MGTVRPRSFPKRLPSPEEVPLRRILILTSALLVVHPATTDACTSPEPCGQPVGLEILVAPTVTVLEGPADLEPPRWLRDEPAELRFDGYGNPYDITWGAVRTRMAWRRP